MQILKASFKDVINLILQGIYKMATLASTVNEIVSFLKNEEIRHELTESETDAKIIFGFGTEDITIGVAILIQEDGEFVQFRCIQMFDDEKILNTKYKAELYEYLLFENYQRKLGAWCLDPSDGDMYMTINMPIVSAELELSQIKRIWMSIQVSMVDRYKEIASILETGRFSVDETEEPISITEKDDSDGI